MVKDDTEEPRRLERSDPLESQGARMVRLSDWVPVPEQGKEALVEKQKGGST